jgi:hypothetical protein
MILGQPILLVLRSALLLTGRRARELAWVFGSVALMAQACAQDSIDPDLPQPLSEEVFEKLLDSPPFIRTLGVGDSLILTGIANTSGTTIATLFDTDTKKSHTVSQKPNHEGWQLLGVGGDPKKNKTWQAKIQIRGGEVVTVRYAEPPPRLPRVLGGGLSGGVNGSGGNGGPPGGSPQLSRADEAVAKNAAVNYKEGFTSDGYPEAPPKEMVERLSRLSVGQREDINRQMIGLKNQGLGMPERRKIYEGMVDRALRQR